MRLCMLAGPPPVWLKKSPGNGFWNYSICRVNPHLHSPPDVSLPILLVWPPQEPPCSKKMDGISIKDGLFGAPAIRILTSEHRHGSIDRAVRYLGMGNRSLITL